MQETLDQEIQWLLKEKHQGKETKAFYKDIKRLQKGEPLSYVIGFCEFLNCNINLSLKPLIPRSETEYWVGRVVESLKLKVESRKTKVLDVFAGSGCIGVSIMRHI